MQQVSPQRWFGLDLGNLSVKSGPQTVWGHSNALIESLPTSLVEITFP